MPCYSGKPCNQSQLKYWQDQLKLDKANTSDLNALYYCVHTIIPEYVVNTHARLYFEDLASAEEYLVIMRSKGIYAVLEKD